MSRKLSLLSRAGVLLALLGGACTSNIFGGPCPIPDTATDEERRQAIAACYGITDQGSFDANLRRQVDILFLIDNSPSMSPKQAALASKFAGFMQEIEKTGADYHVGIATSDVGGTTAEGMEWGSVLAACNRFKGDDGVLQNKACTDRPEITDVAQRACGTICTEPNFVPKNGARYIEKSAGITNVPTKMELVNGQMVDVGPIKAFQCMALVGDAGCGIESQLEGARRALDGHAPENTGFLRPSSTLAVIFITDEDDCSMPIASRSQNNPTTSDCSTGDQNAPYSCYDPDYRCLARSVQCDQPMNTVGEKTNCKERENNYLERVDNYFKFFQNLRRPERLFVSGIWTLDSLEKGAKLVVSTGTGGTTTPFLNRAGKEQASCYYNKDSSIFGNAQVRLSKFAALFGTTKDKETGAEVPAAPEFSICNIDNYQDALVRLGKLVAQKIEPACLNMPAKRDAKGNPVCLVGDVDESTPAASPDVFFPTCGKKNGTTTCCDAWANSPNPTPADDNIKAACSAEPEDCFCAIKSKVGVCDNKREVVGVWRKNGGSPPPGKVINFRCASAG